MTAKVKPPSSKQSVIIGGAALSLIGGLMFLQNASVSSFVLVATPSPTPNSSPTPTPSPSPSPLLVESIYGPITQNEFDSYLSHLPDIQSNIPVDNIANAIALQKELGSMLLIYELALKQNNPILSNFKPLLDTIVSSCDAIVAARNDVLSTSNGQQTLFTNKIEPAWPNDIQTTPIVAEGEQGQIIGYLYNCAAVILNSKNIGTDLGQGRFGDIAKYDFGKAITFVKSADFAMTNFVLASQLAPNSALTSDHLDYQFWSESLVSASPSLKKAAGKASILSVPLNQQMMFNYAFLKGIEAHEALKKKVIEKAILPPQLAANEAYLLNLYDTKIRASLSWFFKNVQTQDKHYFWFYSIDKDSSGKHPGDGGYEDSVHGNWDIIGFYTLYSSNRYSTASSTLEYPLTSDSMTYFANTFYDVIKSTDGTTLSGYVDGTSTVTTTGTVNHGAVESSQKGRFLLLADFLPSNYSSLVMNELKANKKSTGTYTPVSTDLSVFSQILWLKSTHPAASQ